MADARTDDRSLRRRDRGFTLVELVTVTAVTGIIMTSLLGGLVAVLRNEADTNQRITETHSLQGLTTWLPVDVNSTPPGAVETGPGLSSGCVGPSPGTNLLRLTWNEWVSGVTTTYRANYRLVDDGDTDKVVRITCSGIGSLGDGKQIPVAPEVMKDISPCTGFSVPANAFVQVSGSLVRMVLVQPTCNLVEVDSAQKNPGATLPPQPSPFSTTTFVPTTTSTTTTTTTVAPTTTVPSGPTTTAPGGSTTTSTSTTTTTTTTIAPTTTTTVPCTVGSMSLNPTSVRNNASGGGSGTLRSNVTVTIAGIGATCGALTLTYDTGASNGLLIQNFPSVGDPRSIILYGAPAGTELWAKNNSPGHLLSVSGPGGVVYRSVYLVVR